MGEVMDREAIRKHFAKCGISVVAGDEWTIAKQVEADATTKRRPAKLAKGSQEAKKHMAKLRALRKKHETNEG